MGLMSRKGRMERSISIGPVQPKKVVHLERWTRFFETFPFSFRPIITEILVEWIAPNISAKYNSSSLFDPWVSADKHYCSTWSISTNPDQCWTKAVTIDEYSPLFVLFAIRDYSLFDIRVYSLFAIRDYSLFWFSRHPFELFPCVVALGFGLPKTRLTNKTMTLWNNNHKNVIWHKALGTPLRSSKKKKKSFQTSRVVL